MWWHRAEPRFQLQCGFRFAKKLDDCIGWTQIGKDQFVDHALKIKNYTNRNETHVKLCRLLALLCKKISQHVEEAFGCPTCISCAIFSANQSVIIIECSPLPQKHGYAEKCSNATSRPKRKRVDREENQFRSWRLTCSYTNTFSVCWTYAKLLVGTSQVNCLPQHPGVMLVSIRAQGVCKERRYVIDAKYFKPLVHASCLIWPLQCWSRQWLLPSLSVAVQIPLPKRIVTSARVYRGGPHMRSLISIDSLAPEMEPESAHVVSAVSVP